ncbi:MAG: zinc ribbon domain-containing protein [Chloroflexota bacterium]|nr:zinc ribbon domain-containing protein [Chloroflexota bacterium]
MVETLGRGALVLIALGLAYLVAMWFVLVVWTFRDIESRSRSVVTQVVSTLMVVLFFVPGVLLYLILRPKVTLDEAFQRSLEEEYLLQDLEELPLCSSCHRYVEDDFLLCPHCHAVLREPCGNCSRLVDLRWPLCPYCSTVQHGRTTARERVEAPAARWTSPELRRRRALEGIAASPSRPSLAATVARPAEQSVPADQTNEPTVHPEQPNVQRRPASIAFVEGMRALVRPFDQHNDGKSRNAAERSPPEIAVPDGSANGPAMLTPAEGSSTRRTSLRRAVDLVEQAGKHGPGSADPSEQTNSGPAQGIPSVTELGANGHSRSSGTTPVRSVTPTGAVPDRKSKPPS